MAENGRDTENSQVNIHECERIAWRSPSSMDVSVACVEEMILGNRITL